MTEIQFCMVALTGWSILLLYIIYKIQGVMNELGKVMDYLAERERQDLTRRLDMISNRYKHDKEEEG